MHARLLIVPTLVLALSGCVVTVNSANTPGASTAPSSQSAPPAATLVYSTSNGSAHEVHRLNLSTGQDAFIASGWNPRISADSATLLYQRDGTYPAGKADALYARDLRAGTERALFRGDDYLVGSGFAREGGVVFDYECTIRRASPDGAVNGVLRQGDCFDDAPNVNPVSGAVAFHNTNLGGLWTMNADGSNAQRIPNTRAGDAWPAWSPDGRFISFLRTSGDLYRGALYRVRPDGSELQLLFIADSSRYVKPSAAWTPDGSAVIALVSSNGQSGLRLIRADGTGDAALSIPNPERVDFVGNAISATSSPAASNPTTPPSSPPTTSIPPATPISAPTATPSINLAVNAVQFGGALEDDVTNNAEVAGRSLGVDRNGNPVVAFTQLGKLYVKRWSGGAWTQLGDTLNFDPTQDALEPTLALDTSGNPVVAWQESFDNRSAYRVYVKRWTPQGWALYSGALNLVATQSATAPALALEANGAPVVAWSEDEGGTKRVFVKRWQSGAWTTLGAAVNASPIHDAERPALAIDRDGRPVLAWQEYNGQQFQIFVKGWNGAGWQAPNNNAAPLNVNPVNDAVTPSLALASSGEPVVAWDESTDTNHVVYVKRWQSGAWALLGGALNTNAVSSDYTPSLALDSSNNPVVAFNEAQESTRVYVKRWTAQGWTQLGATVNNDPGAKSYLVSLALDAAGSPLVAWAESDNTSLNVYVKRLAR
jgi:hypothetical protein